MKHINDRKKETGTEKKTLQISNKNRVKLL